MSLQNKPWFFNFCQILIIGLMANLVLMGKYLSSLSSLYIAVFFFTSSSNVSIFFKKKKNIDLLIKLIFFSLSEFKYPRLQKLAVFFFHASRFFSGIILTIVHSISVLNGVHEEPLGIRLRRHFQIPSQPPNDLPPV